MSKLTQRQENFCLAYIEIGNASEAYRQSYSAVNMKPDTVWRAAKTLLDNSKVSARVTELREYAASRNEITVDSLISELEEARQLARQECKPEAMVSATMGKAKITGKDKVVLEHRGDIGLNVQVSFE